MRPLLIYTEAPSKGDKVWGSSSYAPTVLNKSPLVDFFVSLLAFKLERSVINCSQFRELAGIFSGFSL